MTDLRDLILDSLPEDGATVGNQALLARLRQAVPDLTDAAYAAIRDALVAEGLLVKGRGRGGSVALVAEADADEAEDDEGGDEDGFELTSPEVPAPRARRSAPTKKRRVKADGPVQVISYRHNDTRVNNPEVGMVHPENDPDEPRTAYAYDPHIDPALMFDSARSKVERVIDDALASGDPAAMRDALEELRQMQAPYLAWAGKAERTAFEVDTVSLHVHERVDPATILAHARRRLKGEKAGEVWRQADLFAAPFENLPLRQALDFYKHEKGWSNRLIAGDSLLVMNSLLQKEAMSGKVQMIYIDPPYGIKYGSNFQPFVGKRDVKDGADADLTQEPEMIKAFRDTWELGIHSYLTYLRDRLLLTRELLTDSGSVFVQIGDENVHLARTLTEEIFGVENFVSQIAFRKTAGQTASELAGTLDYILHFARDRENLKYRQLYTEKSIEGGSAEKYQYVEGENGARRRISSGLSDDEVASMGRPFAIDTLVSQRPPGDFPVESFGDLQQSGFAAWV